MREAYAATQVEEEAAGEARASAIALEVLQKHGNHHHRLHEDEHLKCVAAGEHLGVDTRPVDEGVTVLELWSPRESRS